MSFTFQNLDESLSRHLGRAVTSRLHPLSNGLRRHLTEVLSAPANTPGSLLSDPVFEATFDYERADQTMDQLAGSLLSSSLIDALDAPGDRRFARTLRPFMHQLRAWQALLSDTPTSTLISSGTGSGKTECFLIPILEDLIRQSARTGPLVGVRALFLYPLNALIASQEGRLSAWTAPLGDRVRFCLYNGLTPEELKELDHARGRSQVRDRKRLRQSPPPILVTNATMLEYMLVRTQDRPILEASKGKLRWIVLDEAHTYIGSQAAELALLIRRVMQAFAVEPADVRLVATSATIGDSEGEGLRRFLADVGGLPLERVVFVKGHRALPPLPVSPSLPGLPDVDQRAVLRTLTPESRLESLARYESIQNLRQDLFEGPKTLTELAERHDESPSDVASSLDLCHAAIKDGQALIPMRGHRFVRTLPGLWACSNPRCDGRRDSSLDTVDWTHGKLFFESRERCDTCESVVAELVFCRTCGADWLAFSLEIQQGLSTLIPHRFASPDTADLKPDRSAEADEDDGGPVSSRAQKLRLLGPSSAPPIRLGKAGEWEDPDGFIVHVAPIAKDGRLQCGHCGQVADTIDALATRGYASRPFLLGVALPQALGHMPPERGPSHIRLPLEGRRLLTFTDSRQGSARFAMLLEQEGERRFVQSWTYHQLWAEHTPTNLIELEARVSQLEQAVRQSPFLADMLREEKTRLESARRSGPSMSWDKLVERLAETSEISWIRKVNFPLHPKFDNPRTLATFLLQRELIKRPRRSVTLETLGLVALRAPSLTSRVAPTAWRSLGGADTEWQEYLGLALELVRSRNAVSIDDDLAQWLGQEFRRSFLVGADADDVAPPTQRFYSRSDTFPPRGRLVNLLIHRFRLDPGVALDAATIRAVLEEVWQALRTVLTTESDGHRLDWSRLELFVPTSVVRCPVTLRALPYAPGDVTSYAPPDAPTALARGQRFPMPSFAHAFPAKPTNPHGRAAVQAWLENDPTIATLREVGLWVEFSDRIAEYADYFRAHEHSAQIPAGQLRSLEASFSSGEVNILSCSTTMEMGIDIGGLSVVAMNNAPPGPANFLQRAGRAGRRGETTSLSLTMCRPSPHDEAIWRNPTWPFRTPIAVPKIALESRRIVERHVNAFLLGRFLAEAPDMNAIKLQCGHFFLPLATSTRSACDRFIDWLAAPLRVTQLGESLSRIIQGSAIDGDELDQILARSGMALDQIARNWNGERIIIEAELGLFTDTRPEDKAARKSLELTLERLDGEFLLKELSGRAWLPVHGFPTDVVPFIPLHIKDLERQRDTTRSNREDDARMSGVFPTRNLPIALSEYAPGAGVVIDGKVHVSRGVTLNWKLSPQAVDPMAEVQSLREATRCRSCGAIADHSQRIEVCERCASVDLERVPYLVPAGFAVAIFEDAHNDLAQARATPAEEPWVACESPDWAEPLPFLRYRGSHDGKIFYHNRGAGRGYGICLRCGAAAPMVDNGCPGLANHRPLRGYRSQRNSRTGSCLGNDETHAIQHHRSLGKMAISDVFEIQLRFPESLASPSDNACTSTAVALQTALARRLGIDRRELGFATTQHTWGDLRVPAVALYDTAPGGAGYAPRAMDDEVDGIARLLLSAREVLSCPEHKCDRACHGCLLSYDTDRFANRLDRYEGLELIDTLLSALGLDPELVDPIFDSAGLGAAPDDEANALVHVSASGDTDSHDP